MERRFVPSMRDCIPGLLGLLVMVGGCRLTGIACPTSVEPAIVVRVIDAATGDAIGDSACGAVRDGTYINSLIPHGFDGVTGEVVSLAAAEERPGTYTVSVKRPGYRSWSVAGVKAKDGHCGVETVELDAPLQRR